MVIQHRMARIASFYHASAANPFANHGDVFQHPQAISLIRSLPA